MYLWEQMDCEVSCWLWRGDLDVLSVLCRTAAGSALSVLRVWKGLGGYNEIFCPFLLGSHSALTGNTVRVVCGFFLLTNPISWHWNEPSLSFPVNRNLDVKSVSFFASHDYMVIISCLSLHYLPLHTSRWCALFSHLCSSC